MSIGVTTESVWICMNGRDCSENELHGEDIKREFMLYIEW